MLGAILILGLRIIFISSAAELTFQDKSRAMGGRGAAAEGQNPSSAHKDLWGMLGRK